MVRPRRYTFSTAFSAAALVAALPVSAQQPTTPPAPPSRPTKTQLPPKAATQSSGITKSGDAYQFDFQDADIRAVITALASAGSLNVVYGDLPAKHVTLHLNQPVRPEAIPTLLREVAQSNGLRINDDSGIITVSSTAPAQTPGLRSASFAGTELYVYRLHHANATALSTILQNIFSTNGIRIANTNATTTRRQLQNGGNANGGGVTTNGGGFGGGGFGGGGAGGFGGGNGGFGGGGFGAGGFGGGNGQQPGAVVAPFGGRGGAALQNIMNSLANQATPIVIVPDETTNSLLVRAAPDDWAVIQQAIQAVDLRPLQVVIEVMIAEVSRNDDLKIGISGNSSHTSKSGNNTINGGLGPPPSPSADSGSNFIINLTHQGAVSINLALEALKTRGDVRVLSLPLVFAQNNHESELLVGSQRPFIQSYRLLDANTSGTDQVVQYKEVGTILDILPTINSDGYVNLQVYQEVSSATNEIQFGAPIISTRQASASVFVKDGQTVVVGGLTDRQEQDIRSGVPVLSQIPVIGALFGSTEKIAQRTELYLFLTPHIVMTDEDAEHIRTEVGRKSQLLHAIPADSVRVIDSPAPSLMQRPQDGSGQNGAPQTPSSQRQESTSPADSTGRVPQRRRHP